MRIPRSWLLEFLDADLSTEELRPLLTMGIAEVESVERVEDDDVLQVELKPDRGDCLSIEGLAREVAALAGVPFRARFPGGQRLSGAPPLCVHLPDDVIGRPIPSGERLGGAALEILAAGGDESRPSIGVSSRKSDDNDATTSFVIEAPDLCSRYAGVVMNSLHVEPAPDWIQRRIRQIGLRPVNNIVDVTNYVMFEMGQPLHAFDLSTLRGPAIRVRRGSAGEEMVAINGEKVTLTGDELVIADADRPVAIAGVMGSLNTEVSENTTAIVLESAVFNAISVRRTRRRHGFVADSKAASYRFERGVDPEGSLRAATRAARLILEVAGGSDLAFIDLYPEPRERHQIRLRPDRARRLLGMDLTLETIVNALRRLQMEVLTDIGDLLVTPPTWREDLSIEEDLVEEVARIVGFDRVPVTLPVGSSTPGGLVPARQVAEDVRDALTGTGYTEIQTYSLTSPQALERAGETGEPPLIKNPMSGDRTALRTALLPSLLEAAEANLAHGFRDQHLFEIGQVFAKKPGVIQPEETTHLSGLAMGSDWRSAWNLNPDVARSDFYSVRGALDNVAAALRLSLTLAPLTDHPALHPGRAAQVALKDGAEIGYLGELHPAIIERYGLPGRPVVFELAMEPLIEAHLGAARRPVDLELFRQPPATRDLAVVLREEIPYEDVIRVIRAADPLVAVARLFDIYRGPGIDENEKSVAVSIVLRDPERTLTESEAAAAMTRIIDALAEKFRARRR